jgi:undecaprenyl-diphosphatase
MVMKRFVPAPAERMGLQAGCVLVAAVTVAARMMSGVHWLTDIIGGVLLSCVLLGLFALGLEVLGIYTEKRGAHE